MVEPMMEVVAIVLVFGVLAVLAAVPLVVMLHAMDGREHVKEVTPTDPV
jgi:hypothetical protein